MDGSRIHYEEADGDEADAIHRLVKAVFDAHAAPAYSEQGRQEFYRYIRPSSIAERLMQNHFVLIAKVEDERVGVIEMRNCNHVSLLFVASHWQGKGLAKGLLARAIAICGARGALLDAISVYSSPNAVRAYERLGFHKTGDEQERNGIRYVPMAMQITDP